MLKVRTKPSSPRRNLKRYRKKWRVARNWAEHTAIRLFTVKSSAETAVVSMVARSGIPRMNIEA